MLFAQTSLFLVVAAVASVSAIELRGGDRLLSGYDDPELTKCWRSGYNLYVSGPNVNKGQCVEARSPTGDKQRYTVNRVFKGKTLVKLPAGQGDGTNGWWMDIKPAKGEMRTCGGTWITCTQNTPIGLDIDGSGAVETIQGDFMFDISGDGDIEHLHEWFAPTEGVLIDAALATKDGLLTAQHFAGVAASNDKRELLKHSGAVTGKHLFGDMGSLFNDGYDKLALKDGDKNGMISGSEMGGLAVWVDANSNAKVDAGEIRSLLSYGIVGLNTRDTDLVSSAQIADGSLMVTQDLIFA